MVQADLRWLSLGKRRSENGGAHRQASQLYCPLLEYVWYFTLYIAVPHTIFQYAVFVISAGNQRLYDSPL